MIQRVHKQDIIVGVRAMDNQHSVLLDTMNDLRLALVRGYGHAQIDERFSRLIELTRMHCRCEEMLLEQANYEGLEAHRKEHHQILADLAQHARQIQYGEGGRSSKLLTYLHKNYLEHFEKLDLCYGNFLNGRNIN